MINIEKVMKEAADEAASFLKKSFNNTEIYEKSSSYDLVTDADVGSQKIIYNIIHKYFPEHSFLGEEEDNRSSLDEDNLWIVDPIDGTNNYAHGIPHFSISIAFAQKGEVQYGLVCDPFRDEVFFAKKGLGSYLNDKKIEVTKITSLTKAVVATGFYYDRGGLMERTLDTIKRLFKYPIQGIRRNGSAALDIAWVACGRFDAFFEYQLSVWDFAAGILIAKEAKAIISDCDGNINDLNNSNIAVSGKEINREFLKLIKG